MKLFKILELLALICVSMILNFWLFTYLPNCLPKNEEISIFTIIIVPLLVPLFILGCLFRKYSDSCLNNIKGLTTIILLISTHIGIFSAIAGGKENILVITNTGKIFIIFCVTVFIPIRILCEIIPILRNYKNSKKIM